MPSVSSFHPLKRKQILHQARELRRAGKLYLSGDPSFEESFRGSIDRFVEIAGRLQGRTRVLDVGAGHGLLLSLLAELGHQCFALDVLDMPSRVPAVYHGKGIEFRECNVEVDPIPFPDETFDAVVCCQTLEHFTHSHLPAVREMRRVLKTGGVLEVDVPNAVCWRNRVRILRGKHITWDYRKHYLRAEPVVYKGLSFYPDRHNREFTREELEALLSEAGFSKVDAHFLKSRRILAGGEKILALGAALRDLVPSFRKSIIAFAMK